MKNKKVKNFKFYVENDNSQWQIQPPPRRISQAHILTYAFQG